MRPKVIDYQRVTFSFPKKIIHKLRVKVGPNNLSRYIVGLVKEDLEKRETDTVKLISELKKFRLNESKSGKSSLEILREIRYGDKY